MTARWDSVFNVSNVGVDAVYRNH